MTHVLLWLLQLTCRLSDVRAQDVCLRSRAMSAEGTLHNRGPESFGR